MDENPEDANRFMRREPGSSPGTARLWLAFLLMPPVSALAAAVVFPLLSVGQFQPEGVAPVAFAAAIAAVLVTLGGALPAFLTLKRRGAITLSQTLCAGAALGNAPNVAIAVGAIFFTLAHIAAGTISQHLSPPLGILTGAVRLLLLGTAVGIISAAVFWFIALRGTDLAD